MSITIQEGRYYKRRNGEVAGPMVKDGRAANLLCVWSCVPIVADTYRCEERFSHYGRVWDDKETPHDLVEECNADGSRIAEPSVGEVVNASGKAVATYTSRGVISVDGFDRNVVIATAVGDIPKGNAVVQAGRKYDKDKLWAGTVLAGFWCEPVREAFCDRLTATGEFSNAGAAAWRDVLHALFESHLSVVTRLNDARLTIERLGLLPDALAGATRVGTYGARKYERDNWLHVDDGINRYYEAAGRHVLQILEGKWIDTPDDVNDPGSGLANLDHICWCIFAGAKLADRAAI